MKNLSRILSIMLCFAPVAFASGGPVATTAGSNLTAYNPSNANNNQWATMSNGRYDGNTSAKADFGNCNALILRCAQPKCSNGGCGDMSVASAIVTGCVQSNSSCKQYGNDLVQYMSAQLVASSNAKINEQNMAAQQAAAAAAAQQSQQQMDLVRGLGDDIGGIFEGGFKLDAAGKKYDADIAKADKEHIDATMNLINNLKKSNKRLRNTSRRVSHTPQTTKNM